MSTHLLVFAKYWQPGRAKTRLAPAIGLDRAAAVQQALIVAVADRWQTTAQHRTLLYSPADAEPAFQAIAGIQWQLAPQSAGDLGDRLTDAVRHSFRQWPDHPTRLVILGSDSPDLPASIVAQAFEALLTHDLVLGPSEDGGYYLVGLSRPAVEIFSGIAWSTADVLEQTLAIARERQLTSAILPTWYDVDEPADLARLIDQLTAAPTASLDPPLRQLAQSLATIMVSRD